MGEEDRDAVFSVVSAASDQPLHWCLCGGCCLFSGLCPQRQTSSSWTAFPMFPPTILITSIAIYGRGIVSPTKTMLHSKVKDPTKWNDGCFLNYLINDRVVKCATFYGLSSIHVTVMFMWQFLPGTFGQVFLRTTLICCISGIVVWASAVNLETAE